MNYLDLQVGHKLTGKQKAIRLLSIVLCVAFHVLIYIGYVQKREPSLNSSSGIANIIQYVDMSSRQVDPRLAPESETTHVAKPADRVTRRSIKDSDAAVYVSEDKAPPSPSKNETRDVSAEQTQALGSPNDELLIDKARQSLSAINSEHKGSGDVIGRNLTLSRGEYETKLGEDIKKTVRKDCRTAYQSAGLLAIPLLLHDTALDKGCKW